MTDKYFMGIDFGTQGVRCGVLDDNGNIAAISEYKYNTVYPQPGWAEQNPDQWISSMEKAIGDCKEQAGQNVFSKIVGLTLCSTASTVIPVDDNGNALSAAILWMDVRAVEQAKLINKTHHKTLKYCGKEVSVEWIVPKMMWMRDNTPEIFEKADRIVEQQDFMNYYLTGRWCASISQATCKSNYVERMGGFNKEFFASINFEEFFEKCNSEVVKQAEPVEIIRKELAQKYGLEESVIVYQGGIDAHVNVVGLGVSSPGETGIVMGSSFVHLAVVEHLMFEEGIWGPYKNAIIPDMYCLEGGQISAGSITKWFVREFDIRGENPYEQAANEASKIALGSDGIVMLDFFQGNRTPFKDPLAKGVFYGLTLSHTRAHIYRAILEGVAFGTRNILQTMENDRDTIHEIRGCGGVTRNPLWMQIITDVTGKPIVLTEQSSNAGVLGCAIISAVGNGYFESFKEACSSMVHVSKVVEPSEDNYRQYTDIYKRYIDIYNSLKHIMNN